jgi:hypothetical protein
MAASGDGEARKRLGRLLMQARVRQDPGYRNRARFAREKGLNERLLQDIETGYRGGFGASTKLAIEIAYHWKPGSIDAVLAGGNPEPEPAPGGLAPEDQAALDQWVELIRQRTSGGNGAGRERPA